MNVHRLPTALLLLFALCLAPAVVAQSSDAAANMRNSDFNNKANAAPTATEQHFNNAQGHIQTIRRLEAEAETDELSKRDQKKLDKAYEKAFKELDATIESSPDWVEPRLFLGALHFNRGEYTEAKTCFEKVLEIEPGHGGAQSYLVATEQHLEKKAEG